MALVGLTLASPWGRRGWGGGYGRRGGWGGGRGWGWGRKRRSADDVATVEEAGDAFDFDFDDDAFAGPLLRNKRSPEPWRYGGYGGYGGYRGYGGWGRGYWG